MIHGCTLSHPSVVSHSNAMDFDVLMLPLLCRCRRYVYSVREQLTAGADPQPKVRDNLEVYSRCHLPVDVIILSNCLVCWLCRWPLVLRVQRFASLEQVTPPCKGRGAESSLDMTLCSRSSSDGLWLVDTGAHRIGHRMGHVHANSAWYDTLMIWHGIPSM
jgi:hypothetical protein